MGPKVRHVTVHDGVAGQRIVTAVVQYPDEKPTDVTFVGSVYGGPVVMVSGDSGTETFVTEPSAFGTFGAEWVREFFED